MSETAPEAPAAAPAAAPPAAAPKPAGPNFALGMGRAMVAQQLFYEIKTDYEKNLEGKVGEEERAPILEELHARSAPKCLELAKRNGGIYNKAAQFVASLQAGAGDRSIPKPYIDALKVVCDKAPFRPFEEMKQVLLEDFETDDVKTIFRSVEEQPLAAASLAQVHRAVTLDGRTVAVKIQYPGLLEQLSSDFAVFRMFGSQIKPGGFDLTWVVNDFEVALSAELDFTGEAKNAERAAKDFSAREYVKVPEVVWDRTTKRVLTMEFVDDMVPTNDPKALRQAGMDPFKVGTMLSDMFAEMVFCSGNVHGDPHAGNVYARKDPETGSAQIVLLDHGLYHCVDDALRRDFCSFVSACVARDGKEMSRLGERFAGPLHRFFPLILSPWFVFGSKVRLEDIRAAKQKKIPPGVDLKQVGEFLVGLHDTGGNLLGVLHSMGYTRGILNNLGFPERSRLKSFARFADLGAKQPKGADGESSVSPPAPSWLPAARVDVLWLLILVLAPVAFVVVTFGRKQLAMAVASTLALLVGFAYQRQIMAMAPAAPMS